MVSLVKSKLILEPPLFWTHPHSIDLIIWAAGGLGIAISSSEAWSIR